MYKIRLKTHKYIKFEFELGDDRINWLYIKILRPLRVD